LAQQTAYDFTLNTLVGETLDLQQFAGKPLLVVNTASKCGFTPQYEGLQAVWSAYRDRGLVVIGVPSNDFGRQEPGSEAEIGAFCSRNYGVSFPMAEKVHVRGREAHPLFRWFAQEGGMLSKPRWNFFKYIVARDGSLASWFSSVTKPESNRLQAVLDRVVRPDAG
jgi:glutathione peroxidase